MKNPIRVLVIEDSEDDTLLEIRTLTTGGLNVEYERVDTRKALRVALKNKNWDCIISDYSMPQFSGIDALAELKLSGIDIPFILISGAMGEETAVSAMKAGAHDYIMKNNLSRLVPALERELREADIRRMKLQAEEAIKYERILLRTLIDNLPDRIYVKDTECQRIISNKADIRFMGFTEEADVLDKTDREIITNEDGAKSHQDDMQVLKTGESVINREEDCVDVTGKHYWMLTTKIPIYDNRRKITGLVGLVHDVTALKSSELELKKTEQNLIKQNREYLALNKEYVVVNQELIKSVESIRNINTDLVEAKNKAEESDKLKSAFLANMSHEIRTPLNAILGFSSFLNDSELTNEQISEYVAIIESSSQQLLTIINDILDISKIEAGQLSVVTEVVDIESLLNELYQQYSRLADLKGIKLELSIKLSDNNKQIKTDGIRVRQVLSNLLDNAMKFTEKGKVGFGCVEQSNGKALRFFVADTGIGIAPHDRNMIFEPFRQVEHSAVRNYRGNGLGLSISKALVEKLGGEISLVSDTNKGATFTFTIPVARAIDPVTPPKPDTEYNAKHNWRKHVILVVEDEAYNYSYIETLLTSTKIHILHAWNGQEAIEIVKENPEISLVLMDIRMPVMDGYAATRHIKELRPELPVIAQTAYAFYEDKEKALKLGFDNYLTKPSSRNFMFNMIGNYLS